MKAEESCSRVGEERTSNRRSSQADRRSFPLHPSRGEGKFRIGVSPEAAAGFSGAGSGKREAGFFRGGKSFPLHPSRGEGKFRIGVSPEAAAGFSGAGSGKREAGFSGAENGVSPKRSVAKTGSGIFRGASTGLCSCFNMWTGLNASPRMCIVCKGNNVLYLCIYNTIIQIYIYIYNVQAQKPWIPSCGHKSEYYIYIYINIYIYRRGTPWTPSCGA